MKRFFLFIGIGISIFFILVIAIGAVVERQKGILASKSQGSSSGGGELSGDFLEIYQFFKGKGLDDVSIAAIFGNMYVESSGVDWTAVETVLDEPYTLGVKKRQAEKADFKISGFNPAYGARYPLIQYAGIGLIQWTNSRNRQLIEYTKSKGKPWYDLQSQLEFFWMECNPAESSWSNYQWTRNISFEAFQKERNLEKATWLLMRGFIGIDDASFGIRKKKAEEFLSQMKSGTLSGGVGKVSYNGTMTKKMKDIADSASKGKSTFPCTKDWCAAWVSGVYEASGYGKIPGNAIDMWNQYKNTGSTDLKNMPPGAIVCSSGYGPMGATYGHVGIYLGNGKIANNKGYFAVETIEEFRAWNTAVCQGHQGIIGWVMPGGFGK